MYFHTARFYESYYSFRDYASISERIAAIIDRHRPQAHSLLDVACGTGQMLGYLQERYHVEGLDINPEMLQVASDKLPTISLHREDMADFNINHRFDVITCLFTSIAYVKSLESMRKAITTMARHLNRGGLLLVEPFFTPETYWINDIRLNVFEQSDLKIAWMYVSKVEDGLAVYLIHYLIGRPEGVEHYVERHELGLFTDAEYRGAFELAGLKVTFEPAGTSGAGMYLAQLA